jgi:hypothetical protein
MEHELIQKIIKSVISHSFHGRLAAIKECKDNLLRNLDTIGDGSKILGNHQKSLVDPDGLLYNDPIWNTVLKPLSGFDPLLLTNIKNMLMILPKNLWRYRIALTLFNITRIVRYKPSQKHKGFDRKIVTGGKLPAQIRFDQPDESSSIFLKSILDITLTYLQHRYDSDELRNVVVKEARKGFHEIVKPRATSTGMGNSNSNWMMSLNDLLVRKIYPRAVFDLYKLNLKII